MSGPISKGSLIGAIESKQQSQKSAAEYKELVTSHYDGIAGSLTRVTGLLTGHEALSGRLIRPAAFDVRGCTSILDAACGNGRYSINLLKHADVDAKLTAFDLSQKMLVRARRRLNSDRVTFCVADLTKLPYPDVQFDAVVCGWVLEHLSDPRPGLRELARVMSPGGRLLLMCTEDTFLGAWCSRLWHCRTYNRRELRSACEECGLSWSRELWFSGFHRRLGLGGIIVELKKN
jgi:ubiquinone/menaquinone biosynthesis C-methylase UbiE